jgi:hypothetical protein
MAIHFIAVHKCDCDLVNGNGGAGGRKERVVVGTRKIKPPHHVSCPAIKSQEAELFLPQFFSPLLIAHHAETKTPIPIQHPS